MPMETRRNKPKEKAAKLLIKELPFYNFRGDLASCLGQFNISIPITCQPRKNLDKLAGLYDLNIFDFNNDLDNALRSNHNIHSQYIQSRYFSVHSFKRFSKKLSENEIQTSLSIFHNNIVSVNRNLENLKVLLDA